MDLVTLPPEDLSDEFRPSEELLTLLLKGAARRGYSTPEDYLVALVESDQELENEEAAAGTRAPR
jgi:hypothetical protein